MRVWRLGRLWPWGLLGLSLMASGPAHANAGEEAFQPGKGRGVRSAAPEDTVDAPEDTLTEARQPEVLADPNEGPPHTLAETSDPELKALLEADRALFPEPLEGVKPGFSFLDEGPNGEFGGRRVLTPPLLRDVYPDVEESWLRGVAMPNFPTRLDARVVRYLKFYRDDPRGQTIIQAFARRSGRFSKRLRSRVLSAGLPSDVMWLSLVESGHNPTIRSRVGAAGLWQFMPASGLHYGLKIDRYVDERLDPEKSTLAAIKFLSELKQRFGNWELAMAAYNMGMGALGDAISKFNCNDFWELSRYEAGLPWETTLYVPKIVAMSIVMNNPDEFGLNLNDFDPPEAYETVRVAAGTTFAQIAFAAGVSSKALSDLNPQYIKAKLPPLVAKGQKLWPVRVPPGTGARAQQRLGKLSDGQQVGTLQVKFGETASSIAASRQVSVSELRGANGLAPDEDLSVGDVLVLPKPTAKVEAPSEVPPVVVSPRTFTYLSRERVFYPVRGDETLADIAAAFEVSVEELVAWNSLDETARLQSKMVLQVFIKKNAPPRNVRFLRGTDVTVLTAGTSEFYDYYEALKGRRRVVVAANPEDTLPKIARRYGMSEGLIERVNRRGRTETLAAGEPVVIYVEKRLATLGHDVFGSTLGQTPELTLPLPRTAPVANQRPSDVDDSSSRAD
ncbi:MAG: LysM peptidoglycan-binding domain-containing protein [Polyangiaceae bacterium]|nr:LysM peptidoglycan-binding domain-containing protein [Polyangiaceae bacterium]